MKETGTATDYIDLADKLDTLLTATGSAFGLSYAGTGNGTLTNWKGGASSVAETFTITATAATTFSVVGSVSGNIGTATVGTTFSHAKLTFLISAGGTAFVVGDVFTLSTAPKWTQLRRAKGCKVTASSGVSGVSAPENVVDGKTTSDNSRMWNAGVIAATIEFEFFLAETIAQYGIMPPSPTSDAPKDWTFQYWNGTTWVTLDTRTGEVGWTLDQFRNYNVAAPVSATRYRLNVTAIAGGPTNLQIAAVRMARTVGGFDVAHSHWVWQAPGNNGTSQIYVGVHHFRRLDVDYFDWELFALDGWNTNADLQVQAGLHRKIYVPLWNASTPYWFVVNGRRMIVVAKVDTQYEAAYLGLLAPYFTPNQVPYPLALGGTLALGNAPTPLWNDAKWRWSNSSNEHRMPTHSDPRSGLLPKDTSFYQLRVRRPDGVWEGVRDTVDDAHGTVQASEGIVWPYVADLSLEDLDLDGSAALFPVLVQGAAPNSMGQLDGVACLSGQGLSSETLLAEGATQWAAFQNVTRADRNDWFAVELD